MKQLSLEMVRDHMDAVPSFSCPSDYTIRTFIRGDERRWAKIESEAGEFASQEQALEHFQREFGPFLGEMEDRCFLLEDKHGEAIGTATAWYGNFAGEKRGRIHWVGIVPRYQGKKLSKPLSPEHKTPSFSYGDVSESFLGGLGGEFPLSIACVRIGK